MEIAQTLPLLPGDPRLIDHIICLLKSQGLFDQFRKECISDVDTKPAYQNLRQRVEGSVAGFLTHQKWKPDLNKNQLREKLRKHILDSKFLDQGVERIVDQVVNPKISSVFIPQVEEVVYKCFGLEKPNRPNTSHIDDLYESTSSLQLSTGDLLPNDLEAVSPDSEKSQHSPSRLDVPLKTNTTLKKEEDNNLACQSDSIMLKVETAPIKNDTPYDSDDSETSKDEEFESPAFEPIEGGFKQGNSPNNSHLSGMSDFTSHDSSDSSNDKEKMVISAVKLETQNTDSQLSQVSSDSNLFNDVHTHSATVSTFDNKFNISAGDEENKAMKIDSSDASNTPCYKLSNDDNSSDARQSFDTSDKKMEIVNQESDVFEDSVDGMFTKNNTVDCRSSEIAKSVSGTMVTDAVSHHRSSIESKTSTESIKEPANIDISVDSNESKSSDVSAEKAKKSGLFNFETKESFSFENRLTAQDHSMDADDSSSNDLKIDLQAAVSEEVEDSSSNGLKVDLQKTVQSDGEFVIADVKEGIVQDVAMKIKSPKDDVGERYKSRSKESDRKSSVSHSHSKDYHKDKKDDSKHQSKSSKHSSSSRHDSERKHSSSSSHDRKDSSHSKISTKDSAEKDRYSKVSSNGESSKKDRHSSSHRSSTSYRHSSSSSKHHSSSSRHHSDELSKSRHSSTSDKHSSDKNDKSLQRNNESSNSKNTSIKDTSGHGSSHRDRKHSASQDETRRRTSSSNSTSDKKSDEKKNKRKSSKDDHYSSSGRGGKPRRSTDRDSNDGNNSSLSRSHSHSASSSGVHNNTSNKSNSKSSNSGSDNGSSGNSSSGGQSNSLTETINITKGSYIKSEFNMFQPIVKKPTMAELHMLSRSPEAITKKPVIHVDSQLNPVKVEEKLIESPPTVAIEVPTIRKPRFASNIFEARKLMKVRKQIEKIERKKQQEAIKLLEEQQNIPKSESQVFSGLSGPELEFACVKGYGNTSAVKESRTHQCFPINRKDSPEDVPDLLYFDNNPKSKAQIDYERASRCLKKYLTVYNGISEKKQTVIHLIKCDSGLEQAFKRLSTKNHKIKTVHLHQNGAVITSAPFKRVKKTNAKTRSESDLIIPDTLQFGKMISKFVFDNTNTYMNEEPFLKLEKISNKEINKMKTPSKVQKKANSMLEITNTTDECLNDIYVSDMNSINSSYDYGNDYHGEFDDSVLQASKQDIMEIILGSGVSFDSTIVDLKRLQHLNSDISSASELKSNIDVCNGKMLTVDVHSMETVPVKRRKRNVSVHFEDEVDILQSKVNHNNNFKPDCVTPKKRKMMEKTLQESPTNHLMLCTMDKKETVALTINTLSPKGNKSVTQGLSAGNVRRIGLSKPKRKLTGLSKSKILKSPMDIPCSPESDKSVENHINHNTSVKDFIARTVIGVSGSNESVTLNQNTQQMVKSIVRGCLGDSNVFKSKFVERGQRKIAAGFKRSEH